MKFNLLITSFDNLITSVKDQTLKNIVFNIFPNTASDIINLKSDYINSTDLTLNIYNVMGVLVKTMMLKQNNRKSKTDNSKISMILTSF